MKVLLLLTLLLVTAPLTDRLDALEVDHTLPELMVIVGLGWGYLVGEDGIAHDEGEVLDLRRWAIC